MKPIDVDALNIVSGAKEWIIQKDVQAKLDQHSPQSVMHSLLRLEREGELVRKKDKKGTWWMPSASAPSAPWAPDDPPADATPPPAPKPVKKAPKSAKKTPPAKPDKKAAPKPKALPVHGETRKPDEFGRGEREDAEIKVGSTYKGIVDGGKCTIKRVEPSVSGDPLWDMIEYKRGNDGGYSVRHLFNRWHKLVEKACDEA